MPEFAYHKLMKGKVIPGIRISQIRDEREKPIPGIPVMVN